MGNFIAELRAPGFHSSPPPSPPSPHRVLRGFLQARSTGQNLIYLIVYFNYLIKLLNNFNYFNCLTV